MAAPVAAAYRGRMKARTAMLAAILAACSTTPRWQKEGATQESIAADLAGCEAQAPIKPRVQGTQGMPSGIGGERKAAFNTMAEREGERMQKDEKFVAECMRKKGYSG
jgi:hypothetical protein